MVVSVIWVMQMTLQRQLQLIVTEIGISWNQLTGNASRSIAAWYKTTSTAASNWLSWGVAATNQCCQIGTYNGGIGYLGYGNDLTTPISTYCDGNWHHLAVTFDGNTMYLYLDGVQKNTTSTTLNTGTGALNIGRSVSAGYYFSGTLDDIRVYNRALSAAEVQSLAAGN